MGYSNKTGVIVEVVPVISIGVVVEVVDSKRPQVCSPLADYITAPSHH